MSLLFLSTYADVVFYKCNFSDIEIFFCFFNNKDQCSISRPDRISSKTYLLYCPGISISNQLFCTDLWLLLCNYNYSIIDNLKDIYLHNSFYIFLCTYGIFYWWTKKSVHQLLRWPFILVLSQHLEENILYTLYVYYFQTLTQGFYLLLENFDQSKKNQDPIFVFVSFIVINSSLVY